MYFNFRFFIFGFAGQTQFKSRPIKNLNCRIHRRSFAYPTYANLMKEVEILNMGAQRMLTKSQFIYLLDKWLLLPDMRHELIMAFGVSYRC